MPDCPPLTRFALLATSLLLAAVSPTRAESCHPLLDKARRLALVSFGNMSQSAARLELFERADTAGAWRSVHPPKPVVLGRNGSAWAPGFDQLATPGDPLKREGDARTPAGIFDFGPPFGFGPSRLPGYLQLRPDTVCVDDPASAAYNTITPFHEVGSAASVEWMRRGPLYRRGLIVQYPTDRALRAGSCIFVHVWKGPSTGTAGCIALPERRVAALQAFAAKTPAVIAILPNEVPRSLTACIPQREASPRQLNQKPSRVIVQLRVSDELPGQDGESPLRIGHGWRSR